MNAYESLVERARAHFQVEACCSVDDVFRMLHALGGKDFDFARHQEDLADEFADPDKVAGAISISDSALLLQRATPEEREQSEWPPENDGFA